MPRKTIKNWNKYSYMKGLMNDVIIPSFNNIECGNLLRRLSECGTFISTINCKSCGTNHYAGFRGCTSRWCVPCNNKKLKQWIAKLIPIFEKWINEGYHIHLLNLTIKDMDKLSISVELLENAWRYFQNGDKNFRKKFKERFKGGIRSLEVKRGKNSLLWHPHFHMLVMTQEYEQDYYWVKDAWEHSLYVKSGQNIKLGSTWIKQVNKGNMLKSICETLKYILKPEHSIYANTMDLQEAYNCLSGKRQINTWGLLRGLNKEIDDEFGSIEEKKLDTFICQACGCTEGQLNSVLYETIKDFVLYDC